MSSIYKRKETGVWYYQWSVNGKKHKRSLGTDDEKEARKRQRKLDEKKYLGSGAIVLLNTTVTDCLERFIEHKNATVRASTFKSYLNLAKTLSNYFGKTPVRILNTDGIADYIASRRNKVSGKTIHEEISVLKSALKHAWADRLIEEIPIRIWPVVKMTPKKPESLGFYSLSDIKKLKEYFKGRKFEPIFLFALYTGCRRGEIGEVRASDIDLGTNSIRIRNIKTSRSSFDTYRYVPIHPQLLPVIEKHIEGKTNERLFPWFYKIANSQCAKRMREACKATGVAYKRFHGLRHTMATFLINSGMNLRNVMAVMGWTELSTAERYTHLAEALNNKMSNLPF